MDVAALREICLSFPGAFEDFPFGPETSVFKVRAAVSGGARQEAKMFAASAMDPADWSVSLKCEPALAEQLRAVHPEITGAWHMNKTHWNGVRLDGALPDDMVRDMVEDSYDLVVASLSRKQREQLGWAGLPVRPASALPEDGREGQAPGGRPARTIRALAPPSTAGRRRASPAWCPRPISATGADTVPPGGAGNPDLGAAEAVRAARPDRLRRRPCRARAW